MANLNNITPEDIHEADDIEVSFNQDDNSVSIVLKKDGEELKTEVVQINQSKVKRFWTGLEEGPVIEIGTDYQGVQEHDFYYNLNSKELYLIYNVRSTNFVILKIRQAYVKNVAPPIAKEDELELQVGALWMNTDANTISILKSITGSEPDLSYIWFDLQTQFTAGQGIEIYDNIIKAKIDTATFLNFNTNGGIKLNYRNLGTDSLFRQSLINTNYVNALATKDYVDNAVTSNLNFKVVQTLPTHDIDIHTIYLVLSSSSPQEDVVYDKYMYINSTWVKIGSTAVNLNNYYTKTEIDTVLDYYYTKTEIDELIKQDVPCIYLGTEDLADLYARGDYENMKIGDLYGKCEFNIPVEWYVVSSVNSMSRKVNGDRIEFNRFNVSSRDPSSPSQYAVVGQFWFTSGKGLPTGPSHTPPYVYALVQDSTQKRWLKLASQEALTENFTALSTKISKETASPIKNSNKGNFIKLTDSTKKSILDLKIMGKSIQDGIPTITNPIDIVDVSNENIDIRGKNIIDYEEFFKSELPKQNCYIQWDGNDGIEIVAEEDGSVYIGTHPTNPTAQLQDNVCFPIKTGGKPRISFTNNNVFTGVVMAFVDKNNQKIGEPYYANSFPAFEGVTAPEGTEYASLYFIIQNATADTSYFTNIQIEYDNITNYEKPARIQQSSLSKTLRGIPVTGDTYNYIDQNNQKWICDTIEKYENGTGMLIQRVNRVTFDGTETWRDYTGDIVFYNFPTARKPITSNDNNKRSLNTHFSTLARNQTVTGTTDNSYYISTSYIALSPTIDGSRLNATDFKTWLSTNNIVLEYCLQTPIETPLSSEEVAAELELSTYYPITNITSNPDVEITYIADTKTYIDNKFDELQNLISQNNN